MTSTCIFAHYCSEVFEIYVCVCACVRVRACVRVCVHVVYEDTHLYNDTVWHRVWNRNYKEKVIYEDIFSVPIIQKAYKWYRISFFEKVKMLKVSCKG